ncbi:hypothetical protein ACJRO7_001281 [Eucalyptus globulus]|uniref:Uncharacterized protein n=1 Tax=Eucalyptus globulus TaxID=34317 RepID=A0ABD3LW49_EUCGL
MSCNGQSYPKYDYSRRIGIRSMKTERNVMAKLVDKCDSRNRCDDEHDYQPPCGDNIVDGSDTMWHALGLN